MGSPRASRRSPRANRTASCAVASAPWPPCADVLSIRTLLLCVTRSTQATWGTVGGGRAPPTILTPAEEACGPAYILARLIAACTSLITCWAYSLAVMLVVIYFFHQFWAAVSSRLQ